MRETVLVCYCLYAGWLDQRGGFLLVRPLNWSRLPLATLHTYRILMLHAEEISTLSFLSFRSSRLTLRCIEGLTEGLTD